MKRIFSAGIFVALVMATPAAAQRLPGYSRDQFAVETEYRAYALEEFQEVLTQWGDAARESDIDEAMRHYAPNAVVYLDGVAQGTDQIREQLTDWLDSLHGFQISLADFDASGIMSYGSVNITMNAVDPDHGDRGVMMFVLRQQGRHWRIRSQALLSD